MFEAKRARWRKLDNAAKIFPATSRKGDTRVFRFYCTLKEEVNEQLLQKALDQTVEKYPIFLSVMRKGLFWHYLEASDLKAVVHEERGEPCRGIYVKDKKSLLFEVTYYKRKINFEVFHALTDGTGAMEFLRELVKSYLLLVHGKDGIMDCMITDDTLTVNDQEADSFSKHYVKDWKKSKQKKRKAHQIKGVNKEQKRLQITEGIISVEKLLAKAREYQVSITVLLTAVFIYAIHEEMSGFQERKPVVLMVPVNLRKFFKSESMLNFFGWIEPGFQFGQGEAHSFEEVLGQVKQYFAEELTKERIAVRMNDLISLEKHPVLKFAPLDLKNICMLAGAKLAEKEVTAIFSNMGMVTMPEEYAAYIERFGVFTSTPKVELCMCSFKDKVSLGFSSRYDSLNIQRNFFRILSEIGVPFEIEKPEYPEVKKEPYKGMHFFRIFSFCCIAAAVVAAIVNISFTPDRYWAVVVSGGILSMWFALAVGFFKRHNLLKNAMWQLLVITIGCILWDAFTGWHSWSVNYVLPSVNIAILISMLIITKLQSLTAREYMIYYLMGAGYGILLPGILWLTGAITIPFLASICIGFNFLMIIAMVIFKHQDFKEELYKKFHI